ncbi:uncharacterized protein BX664DRAFT_314961 [Halteromyces radiatus]|uniref:uncharacterized protein n=1 Tax=Halteromyces radiatus TaxID=101107 RepID=UPI00221E6333|nr:uncharacterized protein BX664DRAFT_314961 [Halteromyces radiatus]KAI8089790.1 hypothetical protein BX664DRAFT_314961 [Halteromyces radiatus]
MTHLSDYSFLQRATSLSYLFIWYSYRVWSLDGFQCIRISKFRQGELKGIVTLLLFFMIPFQLIYEITSCRVKYEEGFVSVFNHIFGKPETMWTQADKDLIVPTDYSLCIGFSLQTGTLLLLQCFWNYLANSVAQANFMSSKEFKLYIIWSCLTMFLFPILQFNFSRNVYDYTYKEVMPELVYGCGLFIIAILGIRSHYRFNNLLRNSKHAMNSRYVNNKISYFQELNFILTIALLFYSIPLIILCSDGLTGKKSLNVHKFSSDFLICNTNVSSIVVWAVVILIFHPKKPNEGQINSHHRPHTTPISGRSDRHPSLVNHQHEELVTTITSSTSSTAPYSNTNTMTHVKSNYAPSFNTQPLSKIHSDATTLIPTVIQLPQHHHHSHCYHHHHHHQDTVSRKPSIASRSAPSLFLANDSNITCTSQDQQFVTNQTHAAAGPVVAATTRERESSVFKTRQPLSQNDRKPSDDSVWLNQSPKGR